MRVLEVENTELPERPFKRLLKSIRKMKDLKELRLVNIAAVEKYMNELADTLKGLKNLKILDLRQQKIRKREVDALVPLLAESTTIEFLDITDAIISKNNMGHLWLALHKNISVYELNYSRINFFCILEMKAIDAELALNKIIHEQIRPHFEAN